MLLLMWSQFQITFQFFCGITFITCLFLQTFHPIEKITTKIVSLNVSYVSSNKGSDNIRNNFMVLVSNPILVIIIQCHYMFDCTEILSLYFLN